MRRFLLSMACVAILASGCATVDPGLEKRVAAIEDELLMVRTESAGKKWSEYNSIVSPNLADADTVLVYDQDGSDAWKLYQMTWGNVKAQLDNDGIEPPVSLKSTSFDLTTASNARGHVYISTASGTIEFQLPDAAEGLCACFYSTTAQKIEIAPESADVIYNAGTALTAGNELDSPGDIGDFVCLVAVDNTNWHSFGMRGTWVDGLSPD